MIIICSQCKNIKPITDFYICKGYRRKECKSCHNHKANIRAKNWYIENKIKKQKYDAIYRAKPEYREKENTYRRQWNLDNKEKVQKRINLYMRQRKQIPKWNLHSRITCRIWKSLRQNKSGKPWEKLVGYTLKDLMQRLEAQFKEDMSWENMGKWHIDHIKPVSSFNFQTSDDSDFKKCWALENLQPLWKEDNLRKSNKILFSEVA